MTTSFDMTPIKVDSEDQIQWHHQTEVLVVGFGAAGACAAIEAVEHGAQVTVLDRLSGGGASALSGGVVYAGGGTRQQQAAGDDDSVENMYAYLHEEIQGAVSDTTLRRFCENSVANLEWLESFGAQYDATVYDEKGSYPPEGHFLYYSGNELSRPFCDKAKPSRRGHRTVGKGLTGKDLMEVLQNAVIRHKNIDVRNHCEVQRLIVDKNNQVLGVEYLQAPTDAAVRRIMNRRNRWANNLILLEPKTGRKIRDGVHIRRKQGSLKRIRVNRGVIMSTGGFIANTAMLKEHAPIYASVRALGEDCCGIGTQIGMSVGADVGCMDKVSAWRFFSPPSSLISGVVITSDGRRICNEDLYGATIADKLVEHSDGKGWLIVDDKVMRAAKQSARPFRMPWTQWMPIRMMMHFAAQKSETLAGLADKIGVESHQLKSVVETYNLGCEKGDDAFAKLEKYQQQLGEGPYHALDISIDCPEVPCMSMTLGGLRVNETDGNVLDVSGQAIKGLYAAGRAAVGLCSKSYISGLSLADCVFSGRRAGRALADLYE
ncbi:MAG: FAD-binding protein [Cellvibrionaceae bacterium]